MNINKIIFSIFTLLTALTMFLACEKIEEGERFKLVYTDRYVLTELIADAENIDATIYNDFVSLNTESNFSIPIVVLSGDTSIEGNNLEAKQIVDLYKLNTTDNLCMFNRNSENSEYGFAKSRWNTQFTNELAKQGEFVIEIEGNYIDSTKIYSCDFSVNSLNSYQEEVNLSMFIIEDSVIANGISLMNVLREVDYNHKTANSMPRNDNSFKGRYLKDLSFYKKASNVQILFVFSRANTSEIFQVKEIKIETNNQGSNEANIVFNTLQNVLIEDFTGHKCGNCPNAHEELVSLQNVHGSQIVPMAIHFGYFSQTSSSYPTDFTSDVGDVIGNEFGVVLTPTGLVNRTGEIGDKLLNFSAWDVKVSDLLSQIPKVGIAIDAQITSGNIEASIFVKAFEQVDTALKVQALIVESHIIDKQLYYGHDPEEIEDYEHNHVLRGSMNGLWGEELTAAPFNQNQIVNKDISYTIKSEWVPENLSLIVIVYNDITKEILQVEETHIE